MVARCCKMHRSNATNHTNTITTPRPTRAKRARRARTARRTRRTRRTRTTTPTPTTAEQAGDILGNTNNPWGIAGVRSPTIIYIYTSSVYTTYGFHILQKKSWLRDKNQVFDQEKMGFGTEHLLLEEHLVLLTRRKPINIP